MGLDIKHPRGVETAYRRYLQRLAERSLKRFSNDISSDVSDLEEAAVAGLVLFLASTDRYNRRKIRSIYDSFFGKAIAAIRKKKALDVSVEKVLDRARKENVDLIKDITKEQRRRVRVELKRKDAPEPLSKRLQAVLGITKRRAKTIARDQTAKINSKLSETRHRAAGSKAYRWRDSDDGKVRPLHSQLDGNVYEWDEPTDAEGGGKPGEPVLCRCTAEPIFE